jgi:hypothetical protein
VKTLFLRARRGLSFANVMSATAVFVALGGTTYAAVSLSHDSVGSWQIRTAAVDKSEIHRSAVAASEIRRNGVNRSEIKRDAVGPSEVRPNAINTDEIADGGLAAADLSAAARAELTAANAVSFHTASTAAGVASGGNAKAIAHTAASGIYTVEFGQDVSACHFSATVGGVKTKTGIEQPPANARVATASAAADVSTVVVRTFADDGAVLAAPFHLLLTC